MKSGTKRFITSLVLLAVLIPAIYFGGIYFLFVSLIMSVLGSYELMNMFYQKNPKLKWLRFVIPVFSGLIVLAMFLGVGTQLFNDNQSYFFRFNGSKIFIELSVISENIKAPYQFGAGVLLAIVILMIGVIFSMCFIIFTPNTTSQDVMACILTLVYGGLMVAFACTLEYICPILGKTTQIKHIAGRTLGYVYVVSAATDVFAYLVGSRFGKHRLCPQISPKKSVEGAIGGLVLGGVLGTVAGYLFKVIPVSSSFSTLKNIGIVCIFFIISMILSCSVQIGDLVASKLKRSYEIKDYGNIFPGHGGIMDRFDSFIFAGSLFFIIIQVVQMIVLGVI